MAEALEFWLKTQEVAKVLNLKPQTVRKNCKEKKYSKTRKVKSERGRKGWEIAASSLSPELVDKITEQRKEQLNSTLKDKTVNQKKTAIERQEILNRLLTFASERGKKAGACVTEFLSENPDVNVCRATLFNFLKSYRSGGTIELVPRKREKSGISKNTFSPDALTFLSDLFLTQNQLSIKEAYKKTIKYSNKNGLNWKIGSYSSAKRYCNSIPKDVREMRRSGPKKFEDRVVPYTPRDPESLAVMQVSECDHHQMDVACRYHDGRVIFPWLTLWIDVRTWKPLGWVLCERPNSDSIAQAFYKQGITHGMPLEVYLDNGKDFRSKVFMGTKRKPKEEDCHYDLKPIIAGIFQSLNIKVHYALPYNAKAKVIERLFGTLTVEFAKYMRGYRGKNVVSRPEKLKTEIKKDNILSFDELKDVLNDWLSYEFPENREMWGRYHQGATPNDLFYSDPHREKRMVMDDELSLMLQAHPHQQKVKQNGIRFLDRWYWSERLHCDYFGNWVQFRVPPDNPNKIYVFDDQDRFIDVCEQIYESPHLGIESADMKKYNRMKKIVRENEERKYREIVPHPMSDEEREALAVDREAAKTHKEKELPVTYINTRFREALDGEKKKKINRAVIEKRQKDLDKRLREMIVPEGPDPEAEAAKNANKYLRELYIEEN